MRRVVITGLGMVAPTGIGVHNAWEAVLSGKSFVGKTTLCRTDNLPVSIAAEVRNFDASPLLGSKVARQTSRFVQFACQAAQETVEHSGYDLEKHGQRCGCFIGVAIGGLGEIEESACILKEQGWLKVSPHVLPYALPNMASGVVAIRHKMYGPNVAVVTACASGTHAIGAAAMHIRKGEADMMLAGGAEAAICPFSITSFARIKALSRRNDAPELASRPFDLNRDGFVMGEGCGLVMLEELDHAKNRGAEIFAELIGYGLTADASHFTSPAPHGEGLERCMNNALKDAQLETAQIDYINAHGTSTEANDSLESEAIQSVFGSNAAQLSISSTKGATGHCLGAAGGIEAVYTIMAIRAGLVPPTANYETPDPKCPLDYTPVTPRERKIEFALSNSSGFGGQNGCLVFKRFT